MSVIATKAQQALKKLEPFDPTIQEQYQLPLARTLNK
jgi:hypothetical protein